MPEPARQREVLTRDAIVTAAVSLADDGGLSALSMRNLAKQLGYEVMSLYNHVANKNELLALMADEVAAGIDEPLDGAQPEIDEEAMAMIRSVAVSARNALVTHPWAAPLWQRVMPGPARIHFMEILLRLFDQAGLPSDVAHYGFHAVVNHVVGYTLQEQEMMSNFDESDDLDDLARTFLSGVDRERFPYTVAHVEQHLAGDTGSSFELVLDLILDGLTRLDGTRSRDAGASMTALGHT